MSQWDALVARVERATAEAGPEAARALVAETPGVDAVSLITHLKARVDALIRTAPPAALAPSEALLALGELAPTLRPLVQRGRAVALHANGRSGEALPHYLAAVAAYDAAGDELEAARVRRSLVDVLQMHGRADEALEVAASARAVLEARGEPRLLAQLECNVGNVHFRRDRFEDALAAYDRAAAAFEGLGDELGRAYARVNAGNVLTNAHRFEEAAQAFEDARVTFVAHGHHVLAADAEYGAAYLDFRRGRWTAALEALERAREAYRAGKPTGVWLCELDLAELHLSLGAYRDAEHHADAAERGFGALGMTYEASKARLFRGVAAARRGDRVGASAALADAAAGFEALGNHARAALVTLHRAELCDGRDEVLALLPELDRARRALEASGDTQLGRMGRLAEAQAWLAVGRRAEARHALLELAAALAAGSEGDAASPLDAALEVDVRRGLADLAATPPESRAELAAAVEAIERTYAGLAFRDARLAFFGARHAVFTRLAVSHLEEGDGVDVALDWLERGRQRSALERPIGGALADPALAAARAELDGWLSAWLEERLAPGHERPRIRAARAPELGPRQDELLRAARRQTRHARGAPSAPRSWRDALGEGETCLAFVTHGDEIRVVLREGPAGGGAWSVRAPASLAALRAMSERLRHQAEKVRLGAAYRARHAARLEETARRLFAELGRQLLGPLADTLRSRPAGSLWLVPHGALHDLPLHMLALGSESGVALGRAPLHAQPEVGYTRSLQALATSRALAAGHGVVGEGAVLVCADEGANLPALAREVEALGTAWGSRLERVTLTDLAARLAAGPVAALHLAAHGAFQPDHPLFSGMRFGARFLTALDVERLPLGGVVVTLSGCETSRQTVAGAEDPFGPERSFLAAGARAVLGSLWPVDDGGAADFMARFHAALASGVPPRKAYTQALSRHAPGESGGSLTIDRAAWVLVGE